MRDTVQVLNSQDHQSLLSLTQVTCPFVGSPKQAWTPIYCTELSIKATWYDSITHITSCWMIPWSLLAFKLCEWTCDLYKNTMLKHASSTLFLRTFSCMFFQTWLIHYTTSSCITVSIYLHTRVVIPLISTPWDSFIFCQTCLASSQLFLTYSCSQHSSFCFPLLSLAVSPCCL